MTKNNYLPLLYLELSNPGFSLDQRFKDIAFTAGNQIEIDMDQLARIDSALAESALSYYNSTLNFFEKLASGKPDEDALEIQRVIVDVKQLDTNKERSDLRSEFNSLIKLPIYGDLIKSALKKDVNWHLLSKDIEALGGSIAQDGLTTIIKFSIPSRVVWDKSLGGEFSRGEISRDFELTINHAKWRDRKIRRLQALKISATEIWPLN